MSVDGAVQQYLTTPKFNLQISSDKLSLPEIARSCRRWPASALQPAFEFKLNGPLDRLGVEMNVRSSAGQVSGKLVADVRRAGSVGRRATSRSGTSTSRRC